MISSVYIRYILFHCAGDGAVAQAAQRFWSLFLGDVQKLLRHGPGQPALAVPAGAGVEPDGHTGPANFPILPPAPWTTFN